MLAAAGLWGFAEASVFFIVPDVLLTFLAQTSLRIGNNRRAHRVRRASYVHVFEANDASLGAKGCKVLPVLDDFRALLFNSLRLNLYNAVARVPALHLRRRFIR